MGFATQNSWVYLSGQFVLQTRTSQSPWANRLGGSLWRDHWAGSCGELKAPLGFSIRVRQAGSFTMAHGYLTVVPVISRVAIYLLREWSQACTLHSQQLCQSVLVALPTSLCLPTCSGMGLEVIEHVPFLKGACTN